MNEYMNSLEELCETLSKEIKKANAKIDNANGELTAGDIDYIDKLTHALKSVKSTMALMESEQYSNRGSYNGGSYGRYSQDDMSNRGSYDSMSYARNQRRDSRGRYSSERGYSRHGDMVEELYALMENAPDERTRREIQRLLDQMESR